MPRRRDRLGLIENEPRGAGPDPYVWGDSGTIANRKETRVARRTKQNVLAVTTTTSSDLDDVRVKLTEIAASGRVDELMRAGSARKDFSSKN